MDVMSHVCFLCSTELKRCFTVFVSTVNQSYGLLYLSPVAAVVAERRQQIVVQLHQHTQSVLQRGVEHKVIRSRYTTPATHKLIHLFSQKHCRQIKESISFQSGCNIFLSVASALKYHNNVPKMMNPTDFLQMF